MEALANPWRMGGTPNPVLFTVSTPDITMFDYGLVDGFDEDMTRIWEWSVPLAQLGLTNDDFGKLMIHWTIECGNDVLDIPKVPEPATLLLLSSGLAGLAMLNRRKVLRLLLMTP